MASEPEPRPFTNKMVVSLSAFFDANAYYFSTPPSPCVPIVRGPKSTCMNATSNYPLHLQQNGKGGNGFPPPPSAVGTAPLPPFYPHSPPSSPLKPSHLTERTARGESARMHTSSGLG
ncbi:hypothetical protein LX36DRAFT_107456 [Colletotrichum falcatum]|nr:hypothetical protein LX36DRAFT_107456 [Colletotrichum falcatum]